MMENKFKPGDLVRPISAFAEYFIEDLDKVIMCVLHIDGPEIYTCRVLTDNYKYDAFLELRWGEINLVLIEGINHINCKDIKNICNICEL